MNAAYDKAKAAIRALDEDKYVSFLAGLAAQAADDGKGEIVLNASDRAAVGGKVVEAANAILAGKGITGELKLSEATEDISGGLILKNGNISANCALDSLVEMSRSSMDAIVAGILFN